MRVIQETVISSNTGKAFPVKKGQVIRAPLSQIPSSGRATQGVRIMRVSPGDSVASVTLL